MKAKIGCLAMVAVLLTAALAFAQGLPTAKPEQVGLSSERLGRLMTTLRKDVEKGEIPGAIVLIARHGRIAWFEAVGMRDPQAKTAMTKDSIFRIYSMTKPITSVAAMMLVEEGKLALGDPVSKYVPQLGKAMKVAVEKTAADGTKTVELVPTVREMAIQDLVKRGLVETSALPPKPAGMNGGTQPGAAACSRPSAAPARSPTSRGHRTSAR